MASAGARIAVVGATGALGSELLAALSESGIAVAELVLVATDRALGEEIEFRGEGHPVERELPPLRGFDLVFLCAPPAASLECARAALRAEAPCIDLAGALAGAAEVPLWVASLAAPEAVRAAPLVSAPGGATLAWLRVLHPLGRLATLRRVTGTLLDAASAGGRAGIEAIYAESLAIFNQEDFPEPVVFGAPVAFDCLPDPGPWQAGESPREARLCAELARLLGPQLRIGVTALQIPAFVGCAAALVVEAERALEPAEAEEALRKAAGVEVWQGEGGPNLRASAGRDVVLVGRPRPDPSQPGALRLWLVADALSLAAANAVALARARLRPH